VQVNRARAQQDIETLKASHMAALQSREAEALRAIEQSEAARAEEVSHLQESQKAEVGAKLIVFSASKKRPVESRIICRKERSIIGKRAPPSADWTAEAEIEEESSIGAVSMLL
jgi:hypothetical protein